MKRIFIGVLFGWFFLSSLAAYAGFMKINPTSFQIKNSPLVAGEALVGATGTQTLEHKELGFGCTYTGNVIVDAYLDSTLARDTEVTTAINAHAGLSVGVHGVGAGVAVVGASTTMTLTNKSISGEQINSGTVADGRIDAAICRDSELTTHAGLDTSVHSLPATRGSVTQYLKSTTSGAYEWATPSISGGDHATLSVSSLAYANSGHTGFASSLSSTRREDVTQATTNVVATFSIAIPSELYKGVIYMNGVYQPLAQFTWINANHIQSVDDAIPAGTVVSWIGHD